MNRLQPVGFCFITFLGRVCPPSSLRAPLRIARTGPIRPLRRGEARVHARQEEVRLRVAPPARGQRECRQVKLGETETRVDSNA